MIAKARSISHGSAMTNYATKHNRADMVLTCNLGDELTPLAMWGAMETIHLKYTPKFRCKPVEKPTLRMEISPSLDDTKGWTLNDWYQYALRFFDEFKKATQTKDGKKKGFGKFNLDRAQIFACLHFDAKSGIPHLHILINRIDLDGNLMNDPFIGDSAVKAGSCPRIFTRRIKRRLWKSVITSYVEWLIMTGTITSTILKIVVTKCMSNVINKESSMGTPYFVVTPVSSHPRWAKVVT